MVSKEYNKLFKALVETHTNADNLAVVIEDICKYYKIPKKSYVDVWLDFFKNYKKYI